MNVHHYTGTRNSCRSKRETLDALGYQCDRLLKLAPNYWTFQYWWEGASYENALNRLNGAAIDISASDLCPDDKDAPVMRLAVVIEEKVPQTLWAWCYDPIQFTEEDIEIVRQKKLEEWQGIHPEYADIMAATVSFHRLIDLF